MHSSGGAAGGRAIAFSLVIGLLTLPVFSSAYANQCWLLAGHDATSMPISAHLSIHCLANVLIALEAVGVLLCLNIACRRTNTLAPYWIKLLVCGFVVQYEVMQQVGLFPASLL